MRLDPNGAYCMYLRKSRADLEKEAYGEGETLARHERTLRDTAKRLGIQVLETYREIVSGDTIADRPEMIQLLRDLRDKKWDGVLVMEVERLARGDASDQGTVGKAFIYSHTAIITPIKVYDPSSDSDMQYFEFGLFMSRQEYKAIKKRLIAGRIASAREGQFAYGHPPFGYDKAVIDRKKTLVKNDKAPIVEQIFAWYLGGQGIADIAMRLQGLGVPTPTGKKWWRTTTIKTMLRNSVYAGKVTWGRKKTVREFGDDMVTERTRTVERGPDMLEYDGLHEPIIDKEAFEQAQRLLASHEPPTRRSYTHVNPLAGVLVCGVCGKPMNYNSRRYQNRSDAYVHPHYCDCNTHSCLADTVLDAVEKAILWELGDIKATVSGGVERHNVREALVSEYNTAKRAMDGHIDRLERGIIDEATYVERSAVLRDRIRTLEKALEEAPEEIDSGERTVTLTHALKLMRNPDSDKRKVSRFFKEFIDRIEYYRDSIDEPPRLIIFWR